MQLGKRQFRPGWWPTLGMLIFTALFLRLGVWQWHRAGEKRALIAAMASGMHAPPLDLNAAVQRHRLADVAPYRHVRLAGRYDAGHQVLLQSIVHHGQSGYDVLTPLHLAGTSEWVIVNRGWIGGGPKPPAAAALAVGAGPRRITGYWAPLPQPGLRLGDGRQARGWPRPLLYPTMADLQRQLHRPLLDNSVRLEARQPGGYQRDWRVRPAIGPSRHISYMLQWFALAATVVIVWLVVNLRKPGQQDEGGGVG